MMKIRVPSVTESESIRLIPRTTDPPLQPGLVWYRGDLGLISHSPDGVAVRRIPHGTINVDSHASRHESGQADAITGWISPSHIGPRSNASSTTFFRTRDIGGTNRLNHMFAPLDDDFGHLGSPARRWNNIFVRTAEIWNLYLKGYGISYVPFDAMDHFVVPYLDGSSYIGTITNRFYQVHAIYVITGDLGLEDMRCLVCGREFKVNDSIVFKVRHVDDEEKKILVVPVHSECNPHELNDEMLKWHEENVLKPRVSSNDIYKIPNPHAEFTIESIIPADEEHVYVIAKFNDGVIVSAVVRADASEEEVINVVIDYYKHEKARLISMKETRERAQERAKELARLLRKRMEVEVRAEEIEELARSMSAEPDAQEEASSG